jgi:hypothetical protein
MINVSDTSCAENQNTDFNFSKFFFLKSRLWWKNIVELDRTQMIIWRMRIVCWVPKSTNTHSQHITRLAVPLPTMSGRKPLDVTLYAHELSGYLLLSFKCLPFWQNFKALFAISDVILDNLFPSFSSISHNKALENKVPGNSKLLNITHKVAVECNHTACYNILGRQTDGHMLKYQFNITRSKRKTFADVSNRNT